MAAAFISIGLACTGLTAASQIKCDSEPAQPCIQLWPGGKAPNDPPNPPPETRQGDDGMGCGRNRSIACDHVFDVSNPTLTPFLVKNGTGAAIIIAPGGGYHVLSFGKEGLDYATMYNSIGVSAFVLKYRVPARPPVEGLPHWWAPLQDAQRAIGLVRANADKYGIDPTKIGFTGSSAGGHLTGHISTAYSKRIYPRVDAADDLSCRPDFSIFMYPWMLFPNNKVPAWGDAYALADEFSNMTADHPVSAFIQNADDTTAPPQGTLAYAQKLLALEASDPSIHIMNKGGHGFGLCQTKNEWLEICDWPKFAQRFLQDHGFAPGWPTGKPEPPQMISQGCLR